MSHPILRTSRAAALHFEIATPHFGTLVPFLILLLGIAVSAGVGHAS